ncbi:hypothetical protein Bca4012_063268 [Brassica carinata]
MEMMKSKHHGRMTQYDEANKIINGRLTEISFVITTTAADDNDPMTLRRQLFRTGNHTAQRDYQSTTQKITKTESSAQQDIN